MRTDRKAGMVITLFCRREYIKGCLNIRQPFVDGWRGTVRVFRDIDRTVFKKV